jgi:hypothetical protein
VNGPGDVLHAIVRFNTRSVDRVELSYRADEALRVAAALDPEHFAIRPFVREGMANLRALVVVEASVTAVLDGIAVLHREGGGAYSAVVLARAQETARALANDYARLPHRSGDGSLSYVSRVDSLAVAAYGMAETLLLEPGDHDPTSSALSWTAAGAAAWAALLASTADDGSNLANWFIDSLQHGWKWFTSDPEGPLRELTQLPDTPRWFAEFVEARGTRPFDGWLESELHGYEKPEHRPARTLPIALFASGVEEPIRLRFSDGSETTFDPESRGPEPKHGGSELDALGAAPLREVLHLETNPSPNHDHTASLIERLEILLMLAERLIDAGAFDHDPERLGIVDRDRSFLRAEAFETGEPFLLGSAMAAIIERFERNLMAVAAVPESVAPVLDHIVTVAGRDEPDDVPDLLDQIIDVARLDDPEWLASQDAFHAYSDAIQRIAKLGARRWMLDIAMWWPTEHAHQRRSDVAATAQTGSALGAAIGLIVAAFTTATLTTAVSVLGVVGAILGVAVSWLFGRWRPSKRTED